MLSSTYMGIYVVRGKLVKVQQSLVHLLLQLQCTLHGFQPTAPLITLRFLQQKGNYHTLDKHSKDYTQVTRELDSP